MLPLLVLGWASPLALLLPVGLLAHAACVLVMMLLLNHPLTLDVGHWTATPTLLVPALLAALALYGYHVARAGRALFEDRPPPR